MTTPSYANALVVPTLDEQAADLLARMPTALLAGWSADAPQRQLLDGEAAALQFEKIQRAALAYAASPTQVRKLRQFLVDQGYSAEDAAELASAWVDVVLGWYQSPRLAATTAAWSIPMTATSALTVGPATTIVLQASDGTLFVSAQPAAVTFTASGGLYRGSVTFTARVAGSLGNVVSGTITRMVQGTAGLAVDLSGTQALVLPARDTESDDDALDRAIGRWGTLGVALTSAGWRYVIQTPEIGGVPTLTQVYVDDGNPIGPASVQISVGNTTGTPTTAELAAARAQAAKYAVAGAGQVSVVPLTTLSVPIAATLKTDGSNPLAAAQGASALAQLSGKVKNVLYLDAVIASLMNVAGVVTIQSLSLGADVVRPAGATIVVVPTVKAA